MKKNEKWKKLAEAFSGRGASPVPEKYPEVPFAEMIRVLASLSEADWGMYAFSREPLEGRFTAEQKRKYTVEANSCGREWAKKMTAQYGTKSPYSLAKKMGLKVETPKVPAGGELVLFAQFVQPDEITIFTDCVDKAVALREGGAPGLFEREKLMNVLLAHELFHAVEERYSEEIYTHTEKVELWKKPFSNRSRIACLSEIAAMAFAAELNGLTYSPYMLDVLLVYSYDKNAAWGLYDEILSLREMNQ